MLHTNCVFLFSPLPIQRLDITHKQASVTTLFFAVFMLTSEDRKTFFLAVIENNNRQKNYHLDNMITINTTNSEVF